MDDPDRPGVDVALLRESLASLVLGPRDDEPDGTSAFLTALAGDVPDRVYHYTSAFALREILSKQRIWASHANFLNDTSEGKYGRDLCADRLKARAGHRHAKFIETVLTVLDSVEFDTYVACFSDSDEILPQWRGYAADGAGYAIGFDLVRTFLATDTSPLRVVYNKDQQVAIIDAAIDGYIGVLDRSLAARPRDKNGTAQVVGFSLVVLLRQLLSGFKSKHFEHEREWRLVQHIPRHDQSRSAHIKFRDTRGVLVPYVELPLGDAASALPIDVIRCGPIALAGIDVLGVERFVQHLGLSCVVTKSDSPVRF